MNFGREDLWKNENAIKRQISLQTDVQVHIIMCCAIFQITWWTRNFWSVSWKNNAKKILIESLFACTISILNSFNFFGWTIIIIYSFLFWGKTKTNILDCWGMISRCKRFYRTSLGLGCAVNFFEKRELKQQFYPNQNMQYLFLHLEYRSSWIKVLNIMYVK